MCCYGNQEDCTGGQRRCVAMETKNTVKEEGNVVSLWNPMVLFTRDSAMLRGETAMVIIY